MEASAQQVLFTQASNPSQDLPHLIHHDENDMAPQCDTPVVPCIIDHGARCISSTGIQETSASALIVTAAGSHDDIEKDVDGEVDHDEDSAVIAAQEEALDDNKEKEENNNEIMNQGPSMNSSARVLSPRQAQALASQQRRAQLQAIMAPFFEVQHMTDPIVRSRCEKRMLKMVAKKGGHEVTGIYRVTWKTRRDGEMIHCIDNPQVFKVREEDMYERKGGKETLLKLDMIESSSSSISSSSFFLMYM